MKNKVAVYIGHTRKGDKGAYSEHLKASEFEYNERLAKSLKKLNPDRYDIFEHTIQTYYNRQVRMSKQVSLYPVVMELHFNSATPQANGTETLHYFNSKKGMQLSKILTKNVVEKYGTKSRGVDGSKALVNKNDRGYWFVYLPKPVAVIFEPFFGSNEESLKFTDTDELARVIDKSYDEYFSEHG